MNSRVLKERGFREMMEMHAFDVISYLLDSEITFSILCDISRVKFEPLLPDEITEQFHAFTLFVLAGYTLQSLELDEKRLYFEAGFGVENIGSFVTVPLSSIFQIIIQDEENANEMPLFINLSASTYDAGDEPSVEDSMAALLANPENQRFRR